MQTVEGIWIDASYGRRAVTRLNAAVHPLRDAGGRIPHRSLNNPDESRQLNETLFEADEATRG